MKRSFFTTIKVLTAAFIFLGWNSLTLAQYKIMPLGDSITRGMGGDEPYTGYRDDLANLLSNEGVNFDFVGSQTDGDSTVFDVDHEGHGGWRADRILDSLDTWLDTYNPQFVLLHIGTNDISDKESNESTINEIESIVDKIYNKNNDNKILLCSLIPRKDSKDGITTELNELIKDLYYQKRDLGYKIYYVGQNEVFKANDNWATDYMIDDVHPNDTGYNVMAQVYFDVLMSAINESGQVVSDNFNRSQLGITWAADPEYQIVANELSNTSTTSSWEFLATYIAQTNPNEVTIRWSTNADTTGINEGGIALMLDAPSADASGYLIFKTLDGEEGLWRIVNGEPAGKITGEDGLLPFPSPGDVYKVVLSTDADGHHFDCYINGEFDARLTDPDKEQGNGPRLYAGIMLKGGLNNNVDYFDVRSDGDATPPDKVVDLSVEAVTASSVTLGWTAPGDDGSTGRASSYDIRYSTSPITEANFTDATEAIGEPFPSAPGTLESFVVTGLEASTTYYFALKTADEVPNWSELSNVPQATTIAATEITDDFNRPGPELGPDWVADPEYQIVSNELANTSTVEDWDFLAVYKVRKNPSEVSFRWGNEANEDGIEQGGLALMLDDTSTTANGYLVWMRPKVNRISLFTIINGEAEQGELLDYLEYTLSDPVAGDTFKVVLSSDATGHHFDCYVNDQFYGRVSDPNKLQGNAEALYAGVMLHGNRANNIDDFTVVTPIGEASELLYVWGDGQTGIVNTTLPDSLVVKAVDDNGNPVAGVPIDFTITQGTGSISVPTDNNIRIEAESGTLTSPMGRYDDSEASGGQYISVPNGSRDGKAEYSVQIPVSGYYRIWGRVIGETYDPYYGNSVYMTINGEERIFRFNEIPTWDWVRLHDGTGNPQTEPIWVRWLDAGTCNLLIEGRQKGSKIDKIIFTTDPDFVPVGKEDAQIPKTSANGQAYAFLTLGTTVGDVVVSASSEGLNSVTFTATAVPDAPAVIVKTKGDGQSADAGEQLPDSLEVTVYDQYNNPISNEAVTFTVTQGGGYLDGTPGTTTKVILTDGYGKARVSLTLGGEDPTNIVQASVEGLSPVEFTATAFVGPPAELHYVSGDSLTGIINSPLPQPFKVKVTDTFGGGVEGHPVTFTVTAGGGNFNGSTTVVDTTDAEGIAQATLTLGPEVGTYNNVVEVSSFYEGNPLTGSPITFRASGGYSPATKLVYVDGDDQTYYAGEPLPKPFKVKTTDDNDQPVSGHPVTFKVISGGGTLDGDTDTVKVVNTNDEGIAQVVLTLGPHVGTDNNVVEAKATRDGVHDLNGSPIIFTASAERGLPDPSVSTIVIEPDTVPADGTTKATIIVTLKDAAGNPVNGKAVFILTTGSNNNLQQPLDLTDSNGQAWGYISSTKAELKNITARDVTDGIDLADTAKVLFVPLDPYRITLEDGDNQTGNIGTILANPLVVKVTDINNNPIANFDVEFVITKGGGSFVEAQPIQTNADGYASVHWILGQAPGENRAEARAPGLDGSPVNFIATGVEPTATNIAMVSGDGQTNIAGRMVAQPLVVKVTDAAGQPVWGYPVTFEIEVGEGTVTTPEDVTNAYGYASTYFRLDKTVGTNVVKAVASELSGSPVEFTLYGIPGPAAMIELEAGDGQQGQVNSTLQNPLVVKVTDMYGNPVENVEVNFAVVSGDASIVESQPRITDQNGKASTTVNLGTTAGTVKIEASSGTLEGSPIVFTAKITSGNATNMEILSGNSQSGTVDRELVFPLKVLVTDDYGNPVAGVPITFVVTEGGGDLLNGQVVVTDENGIAANKWKLGINPGYNEAMAIKSGLNGSPLTFTATGVTNNYPVFAEINDTTVQKEQVLEFSVTATDDDGDPLTYGVRNLPDGATFDSTGTRIFRWLPGSNQVGKHTVRFVVYDDKGGFDAEDVVITVQAPPVITDHYPVDESHTVYWDQEDTIEFSVQATGSSLKYRWINYWADDSLVVSTTNTYILRAVNNTPELHTIKVEVFNDVGMASYQWYVSVETPVQLISFMAEVVQYQGVKLTWETKVERDNVGFNILRSTSRNGHYRRVNEKIVPANKTRNYRYLDRTVKAGAVYFYKLEDVDFRGDKTQHDPIRVEVPRPDKCQLSQNYPNPFNPETNINYKLSKSGRVSIRIYNLLGQQVRLLVDEYKEAGYYTIKWDGKNNYGQEVPSGVYYYQIKAGDFVQTKRMVLLR